MAITWCETCGGAIFGRGGHSCPPLFDVVYEDCDPEYVYEVRGIDHEDAAINWATKYDYEECEIACHGCEVTIMVRCQTNDTIERFVVTGELSPTYSARQIELDK